jgi:hypothetical protein
VRRKLFDLRRVARPWQLSHILVRMVFYLIDAFLSLVISVPRVLAPRPDGLETLFVLWLLIAFVLGHVYPARLIGWLRCVSHIDSWLLDIQRLTVFSLYVLLNRVDNWVFSWGRAFGHTQGVLAYACVVFFWLGHPAGLVLGRLPSFGTLKLFLSRHIGAVVIMLISSWVVYRVGTVFAVLLDHMVQVRVFYICVIPVICLLWSLLRSPISSRVANPSFEFSISLGRLCHRLFSILTSSRVKLLVFNVLALVISFLFMSSCGSYSRWLIPRASHFKVLDGQTCSSWVLTMREVQRRKFLSLVVSLRNVSEVLPLCVLINMSNNCKALRPTVFFI